MHAFPRRSFVLALMTSVALVAGPAAMAGATNDRGAAAPIEAGVRLADPLVPFVGTAEIGCTRGSRGPVCGGHHSYDAIDFLMPSGTPIISPVDGTIVGGDGSCSNIPFTCSGYGNFLHIAALDGSASYVLAHLSEVIVISGTVRAGQLVGFSGESGRASTPHLHFEEHSFTRTELGGERRSPSDYLGCADATGGTLFPAAVGAESWYDVPAHAGVFVVNGCSIGPEWLTSDRATLDGVAGVRVDDLVGMNFDASRIVVEEG